MSKTGEGKLHFPRDEEKPVGIKYRFYVETASGWRGEFTLREHRRFFEGEGYTIELDDGRRGRCYVKKMVNRVMPTVPPVYSFYFRGIGHLEQPGG